MNVEVSVINRNTNGEAMDQLRAASVQIVAESIFFTFQFNKNLYLCSLDILRQIDTIY